MDLDMVKNIKGKKMQASCQAQEIIRLLHKKCILLQEVGHFQKVQEKINISLQIL